MNALFTRTRLLFVLTLLFFGCLLAPAKGQDFEKDFEKAALLVDSTRNLRKAVEMMEPYFNLENPENLRAVAKQYPREVMTVAVWYDGTNNRPFAGNITDFIDLDQLMAATKDSDKGYMLHHYTHYRYHANQGYAV